MWEGARARAWLSFDPAVLPSLQLLLGQTANGPIGLDPLQEERLGLVDVAHPGGDALVEQEVHDGVFRIQQAAGAQRELLPRLGRIPDEVVPEPAALAGPQPAGVSQLDLHGVEAGVDVRAGGEPHRGVVTRLLPALPHRVAMPCPPHAQVGAQAVAVLEGDEEVLAMGLHGKDATPLEAHVGPAAQLTIGEDLPLEPWSQVGRELGVIS